MATVVLGGGVVGVATAWYLARAGEAVTLVERQPRAGQETSWGNGCVIHASEVEPWSQPGMPGKVLRWMGKEDAPLLLRTRELPRLVGWGLAFARNSTHAAFRANARANLDLALLSLRSIQEIAAETGMDYDRAANGVLKIYRSAASLNAAAASMEHLARFGLLHRRLDRQECLAIEPSLADAGGQIVGGLFFERDEVGDCSKFTQGLAGAAARMGVMVRFGEVARGVALDGGRVVGVETDRGRIAADRVVAALGSYTEAFLRPLGLRLPIRPVKGVSITFPRDGWAGAPGRPVIDDSKLFGLVPIGDRMRISGSAEVTGFDTTPSRARAEAIAANAAYTFPSMREHLDLDRATVWAGLRPVTPTGTPLVGETRIRGLWVNAGHGHLGWTLACGSGRLLADLVAGRRPEVAPPPSQGAVRAAA